MDFTVSFIPYVHIPKVILHNMCNNFVPETKFFLIIFFWCRIFYLAHCMDIWGSELSLTEFRLGMLSLSKHPDKTASKTVVILPQVGH